MDPERTTFLYELEQLSDDDKKRVISELFDHLITSYEYFKSKAVCSLDHHYQSSGIFRLNASRLRNLVTLYYDKQND